MTMHHAAFEALYNQYLALGTKLSAKRNELRAAERTIAAFQQDVDAINLERQGLAEHALSHGIDLEEIERERAMSRQLREYDPMGMS